jgi:hypothetical protein
VVASVDIESLEIVSLFEVDSISLVSIPLGSNVCKIRYVLLLQFFIGSGLKLKSNLCTESQLIS